MEILNIPAESRIAGSTVSDATTTFVRSQVFVVGFLVAAFIFENHKVYAEVFGN